MKIFVTICFTFLVTGAIAQTTIPNSGFETWTLFGTPPTDYEDPQGWKTTNGSVAFNTTPVNKSTDSYSGTYAAELRVTGVFGNIVPVTLTNGDVPNDFSDYQINYEKAGTPVSIKPLSVSGYYKFTPDAASFDSAYAVVILKKWDTASLSADTIGLGNLTFSPSTSYTAFTIPITYSSIDMPDSVVVAFFNEATQDPSFIPAGRFLVDNISLDTINTSTFDIAVSPTVSVYPNPFGNAAYVTIENSSTLRNPTFTIYNILGEEVQRIEPKTATFIIHRNNLPSGLYFYKLSENNNTVTNGKLIIAR